MENNNRILVLGGNLPHVNVVNMLNKLGYYTIVFDYNENPPAREVADHFERISITDREAVLDGAKKLHINRIVNCCNDYAIPVCAFVSEQLNLPCVIDYNTALDCTDKARMKEVFVKNGIGTSRFQKIVDKETPQIEIKYPVVVKPVDASGSKGIRKVDKEELLTESVSFAFSQCVYKKEVIIEEFIEGDEFQVDCDVCDGEVNIVLIRMKPKFKRNEISSCVGSLISPELFDNNYIVFKRIAESLSKSFHITNNTFFFQLIKNCETVNVIELGIRVGGGWSYKIIKEVTGCDFLRLSLLSQLGIKKHDHYHRPTKYCHTSFLFAKKGCFNNIIGLEELANEGVIDSYQVFQKNGSFIDGIITNKNRVAIYMISSISKDGLIEKINKAIHSVDIVDNNNKSIFDRSMYDSFICDLPILL